MEAGVVKRPRRRESRWLSFISDDEAVIERWAPEVGDILADSAATQLFVKYGWQLPNLEPLIPYARQFVRVSIECEISDLSALAKFVRLKQLHVESGLRTIDFSRLQKLKSVSVSDDSPVFDRLHECKSLEQLYVVDCGLRDLVPLSKMRQLVDLTIGEAPLRSLAGIENLRSLKQLALRQVPLERLDEIGAADALEELRLTFVSRITSIAPLVKLRSLKRLAICGGRKISDWESIGRLAGLEELTVESVPLGSIAFVGGLKQLRSLHLMGVGKIPSLDAISGLQHLQRVSWLEGTTIVDGNTSLLLELPSLNFVLFDNRRHYTTRREEIEATLKKRARAR